MSSIFDLKTNPSQLESSNNGFSRMSMEQLPPTRDVTGNNFPIGPIRYQFQVSGQKWWIPSRSYIRLRCKLTKADGSSLSTSDKIAPNMNLCSALFQSLEFRIADKTVSRVSDYVPQVDTLQRRLTSSGAWIDSVGRSSNFLGPYFDDRQADVCSDGAKNIHVTRPTTVATREQMGFDAAGADTDAATVSNSVSLNNATGLLTFYQNDGTGIGDVRIAFPVGSYIRFDKISGAATTDERIGRPLRVVGLQSSNSVLVEKNGLNGNVNSDCRTRFVRLKQEVKAYDHQSRKCNEFELIWQPPLSIFKIQHALPSGKYELALNPQSASDFQKCAIESLDKDMLAGVDFNFEVIDMNFFINTLEGKRVDDMTYLLDLEQTRCQAEDIGNASFGQRNYDVSPSTYALTTAFQDLRSQQNTRFSQTRFRSYDPSGYFETGLGLERFYISYDGQQLPNPDASPQFGTGVDMTTQRYIESQLYSGAYFDSGGTETIQDWHERGQYLYFSWPRDGSSRATRVSVHTGFKTGTNVDNMRMLLFDHSRQVCKVQIQDGQIIDVMCEDA